MQSHIFAHPDHKKLLAFYSWSSSVLEFEVDLHFGEVKVLQSTSLPVRRVELFLLLCVLQVQMSSQLHSLARRKRSHLGL